MYNLIIRDLKKSFKNTEALKSVNLEIPSGLFGLLGENGAGKTTLMRIISTVLKPDEGEITFGDIKWNKNAGEVRKMIGYLPQEFGVFKNITALECLKYIAQLKGIKNTNEALKQIDEILSQVNLYDVKDKKVGSFSGGMKRRLGIAQAILNNPSILVVDEPTAGLDPEERIRFRNLLRQLGKDRIIILSTHIVEDIEATCQRAAVIKEGRARQFQSLHDLAHIAEDKVWVWKLKNEEYEKLDNNYKVISSKIEEGTVELRILSKEKPSMDAVKVKPNIEEGYLIWNMEQN